MLFAPGTASRTGWSPFRAIRRHRHPNPLSRHSFPANRWRLCAGESGGSRTAWVDLKALEDRLAAERDEEPDAEELALEAQQAEQAPLAEQGLQATGPAPAPAVEPNWTEPTLLAPDPEPTVVAPEPPTTPPMPPAPPAQPAVVTEPLPPPAPVIEEPTPLPPPPPLPAPALEPLPAQP